MKKIVPLLLIVSLITLVISPTPLSASETPRYKWLDVVDNAKGQTMDWFMWGGSPAVNEYVNGYLANQVETLYGIHIRQVPVRDIAEVVNKLLVEKQAGKTQGGEADLLWINGENFRTCKRNGLLYGPFAQDLPHRRLVDWNAPSVKNDFGEPVDGMESPWGDSQVVFTYDKKRTPLPPRTMTAFFDWIKSHPGKFTYPAPPDFTGSVFIRHVFYHVSGEARAWQGEFDEAKFREAEAATYRFLAELAPYLWREGRTYPESPIRTAQLFADGEIDITFSYNPAEASKKIADGLYPHTARTFVFDEGTIANTHFVAIPFNAADTFSAMVVADFLLSPEAQWKKADPAVWGNLPAIEIDRLEPEWQAKFKALPLGEATLPHQVLKNHQLPEPTSEILIRLEKGWQTHVLRKR